MKPVVGLRDGLPAAAVLSVACFVLYLIIGSAYRSFAGYATQSNVFFGADHLDALRGWVPYHKGVHPLLPLLVVPASALLGGLLRSYGTGLTVLAAGFGALAVGLFFLLARLRVASTAVAAGAGAVFALSMSQLVFGCIPESYGPAAAGLVGTLLLTAWCLHSGRLHLPLWIGAGLVDLGITITNGVAAFICLAVVLGAGVERGRRARLLVVLPLAVVAISVVLALGQKALFPQARLFFEAAPYTHELHYASGEALDDPAYVVGEILKTFFVFDLVGQWPEVLRFEPGRHLQMVYMGAPVRAALLPAAALVLWVGLLLRGVVSAARAPSARPLALAAALWVLANMTLHAFYGTDELFLFAPHFTFAMVLLALGGREGGGRVVTVAWWSLAALVGANNLILVARMAARFGG